MIPILNPRNWCGWVQKVAATVASGLILSCVIGIWSIVFEVRSIGQTLEERVVPTLSDHEIRLRVIEQYGGDFSYGPDPAT